MEQTILRQLLTTLELVSHFLKTTKSTIVLHFNIDFDIDIEKDKDKENDNDKLHKTCHDRYHNNL